MKRSDFDMDLKKGEMVEEFAKEALSGTIEVKSERDIWKDTMNIVIEYEDAGKPSGIAVTKAKHWVHVLMDGDEPLCYLMFPIEVLKSLTRKFWQSRCAGGDNGEARLIKIPLTELFEKLKS